MYKPSLSPKWSNYKWHGQDADYLKERLCVAEFGLGWEQKILDDQKE